MAVTKVVEFDAVKITNASIQFYEGDTPAAGVPFGCVGTISGETEVKELVKICEGVEAKKIVTPLKMNLNVSAHIPVDVARDYFGLSNDGLKTGVYGYGPDSIGKRFVFTADVIDEFENVVKLIAFPNSSNNSGFNINIENGQDEVALLEMEMTSLVDANNKIYYEAFVTEIEEADVEISTKWHTEFKPTLVAVPGP